MKNEQKVNDLLSYAVEITIRIGFLLLLVAWCFSLLRPFTGVIVWAIILALSIAPLYVSLNRQFGDKPGWSATIIILAGLLVIIVPSWLFLDSTIEGAVRLKDSLESGSLTIPPPTDRVAEWPLIGAKTYDVWNQASQNLEAFAGEYQEQIMSIVRRLLEGAMGIAGSILQFILATIIAGILLATKGTDAFARKLFGRLAGRRGDEFTDIAADTVRNVTKGVLGVAVLQSFLVGLGFLLAGIPYAGIWTLIVLVLAILQLPALIVVIPAVLWLFSSLGTVPAVLWTLYLLLAGASDNILKPILLGKGAPVPMLVIFLGVIGGFMLSGFIGLFTGAIVLSLGYKLLISWLGEDPVAEEQARV